MSDATTSALWNLTSRFYPDRQAPVDRASKYLGRLLSALLIVCALPAGAAIECTESTGQQRDCSILFVHSYHPSLEWVEILSENFAEEIARATHARIDTEFLDAKRRPSLEHAETFLTLLREKYGPHPPDVLLISDDPAFDLLWPIRDVLFPGVPTVFMGLNSVRENLTSGVRGLTGTFELHTTEHTVELALELTNANGIIVLNDTSETGKANEPLLRKLVMQHPEIRWVIENDLSVQDIDRIAALPEDWPIITMLPLREGGNSGAMLSQPRSIEILRHELPNQLFYDSEWMMGNGLVGGYSLSGADHAKQAGELVLEILGGAAAETLPVKYEVKHRWIFDQRELDRFNWSRDELPKDAIFLFASESFWERHREVVLPMLLALTAAGLIIVFLSATVKRQRRAESLLRAQEQRLSAALAATDAGVFEIRSDRRYGSPRWLALTSLGPGDTLESPTENWLRNATAESRHAFEQAYDRLTGESRRERLELTINEARPRILDVLMTSSHKAPNKQWTIIGVATDITATRQLEGEAERRNRLELLGELAGGIAHDFNNLLLVVTQSAELAKELDEPEEMHELIVDIEEAGFRATDIVKQLLSFGRHDPEPGKVIDMNKTIREILPLLQRMIGDKCELVATLHGGSLGVHIDRPQLERVISNLVLNARDAIANTGEIYLETRAKTGKSGQEVSLTVRDAGEGMDEATRNRIFEPFYSTKTVDKGTGLGLSTVYGIVNGSGGSITVESQPDIGTVFEILWPSQTILKSAIPTHAGQAVSLIGKSILLVEDDTGVAAITRKFLEKAGSRVVLARDGQEGLLLFTKTPEEFDLVLSDVVLPERNGIEMVVEIRRIKPSMRVAFISGFTQHPSLGDTRLPTNVDLLKKPFTREDLCDFTERQFESVLSD